MYAEKLVAESLHIPVFAVGPDHGDARPGGPAALLRAAARPHRVGRTVHRMIVRKMLASTMKAGRLTTTRSSPATASHRSRSTGSRTNRWPAPVRYSSTARRGSSTPATTARQRRVRRTPRAGPRRARTPPPRCRPSSPPREGGRRLAGDGRQHRPDQADRACAGGAQGRAATSSWPPPPAVQTEALRARFAPPNVIIEDFINYDDLFPHVQVFVTNGGFGSDLAAMLPRRSCRRRGQTRGQERHRRAGRLQQARRRPAQRAPEAGDDPPGRRQSPRRPIYRTRVAALRAELESYDPIAIIEDALLKETMTARP